MSNHCRWTFLQELHPSWLSIFISIAGYTQGDVLIEKIWPHFTHYACKIKDKPECMLSPSMVHFLPHFAVCTFSVLIEVGPRSQFNSHRVDW